MLVLISSHNFHRFYLDLHHNARNDRKRIDAINKESARKGKETGGGRLCGDERLPEPTGACLDFPALNTFGCFDYLPLSGDRPLDMNRTWCP